MNHRCRNRELKLLLLADDWEEEEEEEVGDTEEKGKTVEVEETVELSLNSVVGLSTLETIKLKGMVEGRKVIVLIDCGAMHNFVGRRRVEELPLKVTDTTNYGVVMGSGEAVQGKGVCRSVLVSFPHFSIVQDFLPLELGHLDMVLGMQWLRKQGAMTVDWKRLTMRFSLGDTRVELKGDPTLARMEVSLKLLTRSWEKEHQGFLIELNRREEEVPCLGQQGWGKELMSHGEEEWEEILQAYKDVFEMKEGLPPQRAVDHRIILDKDLLQ